MLCQEISKQWDWSYTESHCIPMQTGNNYLVESHIQTSFLEKKWLQTWKWYKRRKLFCSLKLKDPQTVTWSSSKCLKHMCDGRNTLHKVYIIKYESYTAQVSLFKVPYRLTQSGHPFLERINLSAWIPKIKILCSFHPRLVSRGPNAMVESTSNEPKRPRITYCCQKLIVLVLSLANVLERYTLKKVNDS